MSLVTRFLNLIRGRALQRDLDAEVRFHLETRIAKNVARGMSRSDAESEAYERFGDVARAKAGMRRARVMAGLRPIEGPGVLRHALRTPAALMAGFAIVVTVALASVQWTLVRYASGPQPRDDETLPVVTHSEKPQYTPAAMQAGVQGSVVVECLVETSGECGETRIARSLDQRFGLDSEALEAVRQWRFTPGTRLGEPVPTRVTIEMTFALR